MKRILLISAMAMITTFGAYACSPDNSETEQQQPTDPTDPNDPEDPTEPTEVGKILVVYFSRTGTTQTVANHIVELTGADVFRIEAANPYPADYTECTQRATQEKNTDARPAITGTVENMADYDTVFIGYPIWYSSRPMIIATFLETYDFSGRSVIPFCTHGGSGRANSFNEVAAHTPNSTHPEGIAISSSQASSSRSLIQTWLRGLEVIE